MDGFGLPLMEDERLLELGMMVLHEILSRQLHASKKGVAKKKAPAKQKKAVAISDEEVSLTIDDFPESSFDSQLLLMIWWLRLRRERRKRRQKLKEVRLRLRLNSATNRS